MRIYLTLLLFGLSNLLICQTRSFDTLDLKDALDSNLIEIEIEGYSGRSEYLPIDGSGFYFGQCITITIKSIEDPTVLINVPAGSILRCRDTLVQDMIVTRSFDLPLYRDRYQGYLIYAMCGEISDAGPRMNTFYDFGGMAEPDVVAIAQLIEKNNIQNKIGQYTMWAVRHDLGSKKLRQYGASYDELQMVVDHINEAGLSTKLTEQIPPSIIKADLEIIEKDNLKEETNEEFEINKLTWLLLGACGVLLIGIVYLILRPNDKPIA